MLAIKVAIVYDRVNKWGGAERVLLALHELFPDAPLYTSVYNFETAQWAKVFSKVIPSFLQKFPLARTRHDLYTPLMPLAFASFDFSGFDLVISVTSEYAKSLNVKLPTRHICYCLTPTRYLWSGHDQYFNTKLRRVLSWPMVKILKQWDKKTAQRPDVMVGISQEVVGRIKKYYGREVEVVYPPVKINSKHEIRNSKQILNLNAKNLKREGYYLVVSRLVPYKKVDLVVEAFNELKLPLVVVGTGSKEKSLRRLSKSKKTIFVGQVTDQELAYYYKNCKTLIFPQEEDFGIVAVEAQAFGKPVLAYRRGGVRETVIDGKTGLFFDKQTIDSIIKGVGKMEKARFNADACMKNAEKFSKEKFLKNFAKLTDSIARR